VLAWSISGMAQGQTFTIPRDQAECLSALPDPESIISMDPVILRLGACPDIVAGSTDLMGSSRNSSPGFLVPRLGKGDGILIMRRREVVDRKSTRLNSSHVKISYAVFCLKKKIT